MTSNDATLVATHRRAAPRVMLYALGVSGIGQTRRAIRLGAYLQRERPAAVVRIISGVPGAERMFPGVSGAVVGAPVFTDLARDPLAADPLTVERALITLVDEFVPDVFVSTTHAGLVGEVIPVLRRLGRRGCRRVLALRDIYGPPRYVEEFARLSRDEFEQVIVGGPDDARSRPPVGLRRDRDGPPVTCVGYLRPLEADHAPERATPSFWCHVGGGRDGFALAAGFLALAPALHRLSSRARLDLSAGVLMSPQEREELATRSASVGVGFDTWVVDPQAAGRHASDCVFSMAGYNACVEAAWFGAPAVLSPRRSRDDDEQWLRAAQFASYFANVVTSRSPSPEDLLRALDEARRAGTMTRPSDAPATFADPAEVVSLIIGEQA